MRVVLVLWQFPLLSETFIVTQFLGLLRKGHDVRVVCRRSTAKDWKQFADLQARPELRSRVRRLWPARQAWLRALAMPAALGECLLRNPGATARYLRRGWPRFGWETPARLYADAPYVLADPEVIHFEFGGLARGRTHLKELLGARLVVSFRGYDVNFEGADDPEYYREVWEHADAIHCLGRDVWARVLERGCPPEKAHRLIPPAIDTDLFRRRSPRDGGALGTPERPFRVLSVSRVVWKKGLEYGLDAVRRLRDSGLSVEYRIVGTGEYMDAIGFCRHQLGLEDCVKLLGALPAARVREEMEWADVFLHPAVSEGFGNSVLEAQAMNLPVVCSDAGGLSENVSDGVTGWVVPRRDPAAMAERLHALAADGEVRLRMGEAGRERVCSRFRLEDQIEAFHRLYQDVVSGAAAGDGGEAAPADQSTRRAFTHSPEPAAAERDEIDPHPTTGLEGQRLRNG